MRAPELFRKVITATVILAVCFMQAVPFGAAFVQGSSFDVLEFEKVYIFSLSFDSCFAGESTSLGTADGGISASASSSGGESVSFSITTGKDFDSSVAGKSGAVLELTFNIPDINGFLDSAGNFLGGNVTLSVLGIEYNWSLDDIGIAQGENTVRLNMRTATTLYPQTDDTEDYPVTDMSDDVEGETTFSACTLTLSLKKLPSKEKASFILKEVAIALPHVTAPDGDDSVLPSDNIGKTQAIVALCVGTAVVAAIFITSVILVKKEQEKKRKKRRKKRIDSEN